MNAVPAAPVCATESALPDGTLVAIRPLGADDADALRRFHDGLSRETVYYRFFCMRGPLTDAEVDYFTGVDQRSRVALAAYIDNTLIGVARYDRLPRTTDAEVACVVTDIWQGHGVGTVLLSRLVEIARRSGVRRFVADTLASNTRMLRLLADMSPVRTADVDHGLAHVLVDIPRPRDRRRDTTERCITG